MRNIDFIRGHDYEPFIPGEILLSSTSIGLEEYFISWHTQPKEIAVSSRPATSDHQFVLYESEEEHGEYQYNQGIWENYVKRKNDWYFAPATCNQINWKPNVTGVDEPSTICRIHIPHARLQKVVLECSIVENPIIQLEHSMNIQDSFMTSLAHELKNELTNPTYSSKIYLEKMIDTFVLHVLKRHCTIESISTTKKYQFPRFKQQILIDYIKKNLHRNISVQELSEVAYLSKFHFIRRFKDTFDVPPYQYVLNKRIQHASYLLQTTNLPITIISEQCCFKTVSNFSSAFSKNMKISPNVFRSMSNWRYERETKLT